MKVFVGDILLLLFAVLLGAVVNVALYAHAVDKYVKVQKVPVEICPKPMPVPQLNQRMPFTI